MTMVRPMDTVRWGIIGCGDVTEVKSGPGFQKADGSALVAVMRRDAAKAEDYARRHGVPRWYADAEALVRDPDVDAVYVATPPSTHKPYTAARRARPASRSTSRSRWRSTTPSAEAMIDACRDGRRAAVHRLLPAGAAALRDASRRSSTPARSADPGRRHQRVSRLHAAAGRAARGASIPPSRAAASSSISLRISSISLDYIVGPIAEVAGGAANQGGHYAAEDVVTAAFACAGGARGTGLWSFSASGDTDRIEIVGTRGRITFATFSDAPVAVETGTGGGCSRSPSPPTSSSR